MQYLISLSLTLLFEEAFALLWGIRGRDLLLVALANVLTNPAVVLIHGLAPGILWGTALPELGAVALEAAVYTNRENRIRAPICFAIAANVLSFGLGMVLNHIL